MSQEDYNIESCDLIINITLFHRNCTCAVWNSQCKLKFESESQKSVINPSPKNNKMLNLFIFIFIYYFKLCTAWLQEIVSILKTKPKNNNMVKFSSGQSCPCRPCILPIFFLVLSECDQTVFARQRTVVMEANMFYEILFCVVCLYLSGVFSDKVSLARLWHRQPSALILNHSSVFVLVSSVYILCERRHILDT